jgi:hypothetical protein
MVVVSPTMACAPGLGRSIRDASWIGASRSQPRATQYAPRSSNVVAVIRSIHLHAET